MSALRRWSQTAFAKTIAHSSWLWETEDSTKLLICTCCSRRQEARRSPACSGATRRTWKCHLQKRSASSRSRSSSRRDSLIKTKSIKSSYSCLVKMSAIVTTKTHKRFWARLSACACSKTLSQLPLMYFVAPWRQLREVAWWLCFSTRWLRSSSFMRSRWTSTTGTAQRRISWCSPDSTSALFWVWRIANRVWQWMTNLISCLWPRTSRISNL